VLEEELAYWKNELSGLPPTFEMPGKGLTPTKRKFSGASPWFLISKALTGEIKAFSQRYEVTLFMTLLAAFKTLIQIYSGKTDIVIGTPNANRSRTELAGLIGFFANALVLRTNFSGNPTFVDVLNRVKRVAQGAYAHQEVPFEKLVEALQPERDLKHSPLFQVAFTLHSSANVPAQTAGLRITPVFYELETAPYDLVLIVDDAKRGLGGVFNYCTDLFAAATISQMSQDYEMLLQTVVSQPSMELSALKETLIKARKERSIKRGEELETISLQKLRSLKRKQVPARPLAGSTAIAR
jgi:non-ribosomal peptide synthetase component F